ncbi:transposase, partial [Streptomyces sp. NBRC 110611]
MSAATWAGSGRAERRKSRGRPQDLVRPAQFPHLAPQLGEFFLLLGGEWVVPLAGICLGLANPAAQGLVMHAEFLGHTADRGLRLGGAVHPHRMLTQLQ